ncbi:MAG: ATP-binding cassette domain-containing protein [Hyphomicrobiaceae bacterium]
MSDPADSDAGRPVAAGPASKLGLGEHHAPTLVQRMPQPHLGGHAAAACCGHDHEHIHTHAHANSGDVDRDALISARGIKLRRGDRTILDAVDIDLAAGEIVTLIGPNGAGKTTLVRLLLGLEAPDSGRIARRADLRIGYVPQRFDVDRALPMTVSRFLSLGLDVSRDEAASGLADVGAEQVIDRQLARLSGGEGQRVLLARALLRRPNLLVLDEPVRGVDATGEAELYTLIGRLRTERGFGVLLVSHDLHVVMAASDRVLCLNRHVCCSGVPMTVAKHPEYVKLFGAEMARAFAVYEHHHDHAHDLAGRPMRDAGTREPVDAAAAPPTAEGIEREGGT